LANVQFLALASCFCSSHSGCLSASLTAPRGVMVVFELTAANLFTCGSTVSGMGAALSTSVLMPPMPIVSHDLLQAFNPGPIAAPGHAVVSLLSLKSLKAIATSLTSFVTSRQVLVPMTTTGFGAIMNHWWSFEEEEDKHRKDVPTIQRVVIGVCKFTILYDSFMLGATLQSLASSLTIPLRAWAIGGIALTFPASWAVKQLSEKYGFRNGFKAESALMIAAWSWLAWGTTMMANHPEVALQDPMLWYTCFVSCIASWSMLTVSLSVLVFSTMAAAVMAHGI